ncbi:MAG TPA: hypothetical protein VN948_19695 [Terriglobales bacterium]|nr:hypothetical protein [Terriglobales bacterium]
MGRRSGSQLLSWTQDTTVTPQALPKPRANRKHSLLPILIVLFLVSYGLMALLAVEQDRTIASQRSLITSLFSDSTELSSLKGKILTKQQAQAGAGARSQPQTPSTQAPSTQAPMTQAPMTQAPMTQGAPGGTAQSSHNAGKPRKPVPPKPPLGIADIVDGRRIVKTI